MFCMILLSWNNVSPFSVASMLQPGWFASSISHEMSLLGWMAETWHKNVITWPASTQLASSVTFPPDRVTSLAGIASQEQHHGGQSRTKPRSHHRYHHCLYAFLIHSLSMLCCVLASFEPLTSSNMFLLPSQNLHWFRTCSRDRRNCSKYALVYVYDAEKDNVMEQNIKH